MKGLTPSQRERSFPTWGSRQREAEDFVPLGKEDSVTMGSLDVASTCQAVGMSREVWFKTLSYLSFHLKEWKNMISGSVTSKVWILSPLWVKENLVYNSEYLPEKV